MHLVYESYPLFQFGVDNASSHELSARILYSEIVTHPTWVYDYLRIAPTSIRRAFLFELLRSSTSVDPAFIREAVTLCAADVDAWMLRTVCQQDDPALLRIFLDAPTVSNTIDDHLCAFVFRNEGLETSDELFAMLEEALMSQTLTADTAYSDSSPSSSSSSKDQDPPRPTM